MLTAALLKLMFRQKKKKSVVLLLLHLSLDLSTRSSVIPGTGFICVLMDFEGCKIYVVSTLAELSLFVLIERLG